MDKLIAHPTRFVVLIMAIHFIVWVITPFLIYDYLPTDVAQHSVIAPYFFTTGNFFLLPNPPLPPLITYFLNFGEAYTFLPHYMVAQIFVVTSFWLTYRLALDLLGDSLKALAVIFLATGSLIFHIITTDFNHNVAQYPFWVALILLTWRATQPLETKQHQSFYWILLGMVAGISFYVKLTLLILFPLIALWIFYDPAARRHLTTIYPYIGAVVAFVIALPFFSYFFYDFTPSHSYILWRAEEQGQSVSIFVLRLLIRLSPAFLMMVIIRLSHDMAWHFPFAPMNRRASIFLMSFTFIPVTVTILIFQFLGVDFLASWLFHMFVPFTIFLIALTQKQFHKNKLKPLARMSFVCLLYPLIFYPLVKGMPMHGYPTEDISKILQEKWHEETALPLKFVAGEAWGAAGFVARHMDEPRAIVMHGHYEADSPWIDPHDLHEHGVLLAWLIKKPKYPERPYVPFSAFLDLKLEEHVIELTHQVTGETIRVGYAIVKPKIFNPNP